MRLKSGLDVRIFGHFLVQHLKYVGWSVDWLLSLSIVMSDASDGHFLASAFGPTKGFCLNQNSSGPNLHV